jgi:hypothetical protein
MLGIWPPIVLKINDSPFAAPSSPQSHIVGEISLVEGNDPPPY